MLFTASFMASSARVKIMNLPGMPKLNISSLIIYSVSLLKWLSCPVSHAVYFRFPVFFIFPCQTKNTYLN